jgi:hypothetical protein
MSKLLLALTLILSSFQASSQTLKGLISSNDGEEISFASIRVEGTSYGTVSNAIGNYVLELKNGTYFLNITAYGYESQRDTIVIAAPTTIHNIQLSRKINNLEEVVIIPKSDKDKGKEIMKKVIDKRSYYQDLLSEYSCDIYCFSTLEKDKMDSIHVDSIVGKNKLNLVEWKSKSVYKHKNKFKDNFYAYNDLTDPHKEFNTSSVTFSNENADDLAPSQGESEDPYLFVSGIKDVHFSLLDNTIDAPKLVENPLISPLAYNAFIYYNFYFDHSFSDSNHQIISVIKVQPKFDHEALFMGDLYIKNESWELVSYDLGINPAVLLYLKQIRIICDYELREEHLVPVRKEFIYSLKEGQTIINGLIRIAQKEYAFKVNDEKRNYWLETKVYKKDAFEKDSTYWNQTRPFTLKDFEKDFIHTQDSIINYHESEEFLRMNDSTRNRITLLGVLFSGFGHVNSFKKYELYVNPIISQVVPFGVGGYRHKLDVNFKKEFKNSKTLSISPGIDVGFNNGDIKGQFGASYLFNPLNFSKVGFQIGDVYDFISGSQNIQSTLAPSNRVRNRKVSLEYSRELINGLYFKGDVLYSLRESIENLEYPDWVSYFGNFQKPQSFNTYRILFTTFNFEYHIRQKYSIRKNKKIVSGSPWPILNLRYKKGIPGFFDSEADFDQLEFELKDEIKFNSFGSASLKLVAGSYVRKNDLRIIENKFFRPSDQYFFSNPLNSLQLLDTALNTANTYIQFNYIHHFKGFFLNKVWGINKLKLEETVGGSLLNIPSSKFTQAEFFLGLERKIRIRKSLFKLGAYAVTQNNTIGPATFHFKFGVNFYDLFRDKWDY